MEKISDFLKRNIFTIIMVVVTFLVVAILAFFLVNQSIKRLKVTAEERFQLTANSILAQSSEKYSGAVTTLRSLQGFFAGSENVTRVEFYDFIRTSGFFSAYPGFSTIAYIKRVPESGKESFVAEVRSDRSVQKEGYPLFAITPEGTRDEYWPIVYVSPENEAEFLLGNDQRAEPIRSENIARARDLGDVSLSAAVELKQGGVGAIIAAPLYEGGDVPNSIKERERLFEGAVSISLVVDKFFESILSQYNLPEQGINIIIAGRTDNFIPLSTATAPDGFWAPIYGNMEITETIKLGANSVNFIFTAPAQSQLTAREAMEPLFLILIFLLTAVFISTIIIISQKAKLAADLKNRYTFISTLSHQLRTPLTNLRWLLESRDVPEKEQKLQQTLMNGILVLNSIVQRMILYIEITGKGIIPDKERVDIETLYKKTLEAVSETRDISQIERTGELIAKTALVDEKKIILALSYVIENALIYSPKDKKVTIELKAGDRAVDIAITDHGYGIPEREQKNVFSEFFRATNASLGINYGSGVSLFMAKKIIEAHGGNIRFISKEDESSVFIATLPLAI